MLVYRVLNDFSLSVKAANLIFISWRGSAILSANKGNQVLFIIWFLSRTNVHAFHENPNSLHTELTFINP